MKRIIYAVATLVSLSFFTACDNKRTETDNTANTAETDSTAGMFQNDSVEQAQDLNEDKNINDDISTFLTEAASSGMMEVEASKIASEKAMSANVKSFAGDMVNEHSKVNSELKSLADKKQVTIASSMSDDDKETIEKIANKTGKEFDEEYIDQMIKAHKDAIDAFDKAARESKDNDVKEWAAKTLPKLRNHLEKAEKLDQKLEANK